MIAMAERKKPARKPGRPATGREPHAPLQLWVSPELYAAFEEMLARTRRTKNVELIIALEAHLKAAGLWPPQRPASEPGEG